jgi:hypothetical protein
VITFVNSPRLKRLLYRRAPHHARGEDQEDRGEVVGLPTLLRLVEGLEHRAAEGIADDREMRGAMTLDGFEERVRREGVPFQGQHGATGHVGREGTDAGGTVHQRGRRQLARDAPGVVDGAHRGQQLVDRSGHGLLQAPIGRLHGLDHVAVRPEHALRMAGGASREEHP